MTTEITEDRPTSYYLQGEHPHPEIELERLALQAGVAWGKESRLLREHGLRPDADVLEVGPGPGFITELLLREVPDGTVVGLELEEYLLDTARRRLAGQENVSLRQGSILEPGLPDETFDAVHARLVLQHVPDTSAALGQMHRMLRPGGRVYLLDIDDGVWGTIHPDPKLPVLDQVLAMRMELQHSRGGNRLISRMLPRYLVEAGFEDVRVDAIAVSSAEYGMAALAPQLDFRNRTAAMVELNPAAAAACNELADAVDAWMARPESSVLMLMFLVSAAKPGGAR
jgi:ubiquinone/menaquinone biosynthesis C-methylase UbiE